MYSHKLVPNYLGKVRQNLCLCVPDSSKSTVTIMAPDRNDSHMSVDADVTTSRSTSMEFSENSPLFGCFVPFSGSEMSHTRSRPNCDAPESPPSSVETASPLRMYHPAFNPFDHGLKERLKKPVVSPDIFSTVVSPSEDSNEFKWTIEDMSRIKPAPIEEEFHFEEPVDNQTEVDYQQTIDTFFMNPEHHVPSPLELQQEALKRSGYPRVNPYLRYLTPCRAFGSGSASGTPCQDVSTQTVLSLPPELPKNIESMLKSYYSDTSSDDMSFNMNLSLRRKLVFRKDEDDTSPLNLSRSRDNSPFVRVRAAGTIMSRTDGSPCSPISPLGISPIAFADKKSGCNNLLSPIHSTTPGNNHQKENIHPADAYKNRLIDECIKMLESPKLTMGVRQNRKRRRPSASSFRNDRLFYEDGMPFYADLLSSAEKAVSKRCVGLDESKVCMDTFSDNAVDSEDTGYRTASFTFNDSCVKPRIDTWVNLFTDRMNNVHASTPTSGPSSLPK